MMNNRPVQYQRGWVEFYKLNFKVTEGVLIPRPETELLVDAVLNFYKSHSLDNLNYRILDIGTGSGNIAISIVKNNPKIKVVATEVSLEALKIAQQNAKLHQLEQNIEFIVSDLLAQVSGNFDVIVTNLPYIPTGRISYLDESVKDFEPFIALDGGSDGFELYRKLFQQMKEKRIEFKLLVGEIDYTHGETALEEGYRYFPEARIDVNLDLTHRQRILLIRRFF